MPAPALQLVTPSQLALPLLRPGEVRPRDEAGALGLHLLNAGVVGPAALVRGLALQRERGGDLGTLLLTEGLARDPALTRARAAYLGLRFVDPRESAPDPRQIDRLGAVDCLRLGLLPWRRIGAATVVLADHPDTLRRHRGTVEAALGPVTLALAPREALQAVVAELSRDPLLRRAESRTEASESCRSLPARPRLLHPVLLVLGVLLGLFPLAMTLGLLTLIALLAMTASMVLKGAALLAALRRPPPADPPPLIARLPVVSVMVALYKEAEIAPRLVRRLGRIDYPRELLDIVLVVEEEDELTRHALARAGLPGWMRIVPVPKGSLKTKPRALNYALDFCRGIFIGIYDAEDAPEGCQIRRVVDRFHQRGPEVACLQGVLDFYNPQTNWMARCFTMEYAAWFRVILPGLARLGLPVPLGGTTLFFRRDALESLGAWDAHNVTEDADLGLRLARHGYRTELIETETGEEANCLLLPWIRQRSRWIKGYMMTWRVHMREPALLCRQLGVRGFLAVQVLFLGSILHALLAPLLLSFWAASLGLWHPVISVLPPAAFRAMIGLFLLCEALNLAIGLIGLRRRREVLNPIWLLTLSVYHPLASLAAYKALWEMVLKPFYWDKTRHGRFDRAGG
ncbi:glycosyltransferase [Tabrizicola sp. J26]|uniref:glycosyltransferase family 2 protein n=1 Tax=Alitabrizicola rongguiensis TaxID=2909234 RepID=UPI001F305B9F|nr:glycosyltransferase [Tabrizicola rongguiensis]MCF1708501.1 glycosyltransferase [Tabrizicola rongguiensis]